jgi:hypothetical protein
MDERRRDARYKARIALTMTRGKVTTQLITEDVSFRGVFVRMDAPPLLRQLVKLEITLPRGATIRPHAMVVYRVPPGGEQVPGAGLQFYGLEGRERIHWDTFVHEVRQQGKPLPIAPDGAVDAVKRKHERHAVRFEVRLTSLEELHALYTRDISKGGMALETELLLDVGEEVGLDLVHPTSGIEFALDAVVRRVIRDSGVRGLGLEFVRLTEERREALDRFVREGAPKDDVTTIPPGDPRLA